MNRLIFYLAAALVGCIGPFAGKKVPPWLADPPVLKATFSSEEAAAHLVWHPVPSSGFLYGEIQRAAESEFAAIARVESAADTTFTDAGLLANTHYSYRIVSFFGEDETVHELVSTTTAGGFHRRVASWALAEDTAPRGWPSATTARSLSSARARGASSALTARGAPWTHGSIPLSHWPVWKRACWTGRR